MLLKLRSVFIIVASLLALFSTSTLSGDTSSGNIERLAAERQMLIDSLLEHLPKSSQRKNADSIKRIIEQLQDDGVCRLEGSDEKIRPGCVGLQCLVEEIFLANHEKFQKGDFEIHTKMPSTPCCKLPDEKAKETLLAVFKDEARLVTIDGRSASLDAICDLPNAKLYLTYTKTGFLRRSLNEQMILKKYWEPRVHMTCIEWHDSFPVEFHGATYRLITLSGNEIYFGIQASQAVHADGKCIVMHLGTKDQPKVQTWLEVTEKNLKFFGRRLFFSLAL